MSKRIKLMQHTFLAGNFGPTTAPLCKHCGLSKQAETHKIRMKTDKQIWSSISTVKLICSAAEYDDTRDPFLWDLAARIRTEIRRRKESKESWAESLIAAANSGKKITVIAVNK